MYAATLLLLGTAAFAATNVENARRDPLPSVAARDPKGGSGGGSSGGSSGDSGSGSSGDSGGGSGVSVHVPAGSGAGTLTVPMGAAAVVAMVVAMV